MARVNFREKKDAKSPHNVARSEQKRKEWDLLVWFFPKYGRIIGKFCEKFFGR